MFGGMCFVVDLTCFQSLEDGILPVLLVRLLIRFHEVPSIFDRGRIPVLVDQ